MPIMDIHAHTYYSNCGRDPFEAVIEAAIAGGIELFGISDHNHGINDRIEEYRDKIREMQDKYAGRIRLLTGIEICTYPDYAYRYELSRLQGFDYCLVEVIDREESVLGLNILDWCRDVPCKVGLAHTDLIGFARRLGEDPVAFLRKFAEAGIFWEMNVSYDSIHNYREHEYMKRIRQGGEDLEIVRASGIRLSVGFDGHRVEDYRPDRVRDMCVFLQENGIPMVEFD